MNHCVPDFEMDDYSISTSSGLVRPKKSAMVDEEIMELLWQNGQVVLQSQNNRSSLQKSEVLNPTVDASVSRGIRSEIGTTPHLFMQEDENSWLHYPLDDSSFDRELYADLLCTAPTAQVTAAVSNIHPSDVRPPAPPLCPPIPSPGRVDVEGSSRLPNLMHFGRPKARFESGHSCSNRTVKETTVVDSNDTPATGTRSRVSKVGDTTAQVPGWNIGCRVMSGTAGLGTSSTGREFATTCDLTMTSSTGGSGSSASARTEAAQKLPTATTEDRKRKGKQADDTECQSEDVEFESADKKKRASRSTLTKRSRAAEVHNLSERRRRDRINEKMRALQELIPRCNKSDKASMLDEAIEYLKSLQMQVQMMSMGCSMVPMMFPGVQQYMPPMGMGMGMAMGMDMGMNRPMMPFPSVLPGSALPTSAAAAAHLGPRFQMPAFHMAPVPAAAPDPSRSHQSEPMLQPVVSQNPNQHVLPNYVDPYQHYLSLHRSQITHPQNQAMLQPGNVKQTSSKEMRNPENHQSG